MPRYIPVWLEIARQQYEALPTTMQGQLDVKIDLLLDDPERYGDYDKPSDQWTTDFGGAPASLFTLSSMNG